MTREWFDRVRKVGLGDTETFEATYDIARLACDRQIPGDFVECGVYAGAQIALMAQAIIDSGAQGKRVHLFDSFAGLPAATPEDQEIWAHHGATAGESACSLPRVHSNLRSFGIPDELLVWHPGWFVDTVYHAIEMPLPTQLKQIALLRLDCDLYQSTKDAMRLYSLVSRGGWVVADDWNLTGFRKAVNEMVMPAPIYWRIPTK
ncbi:MAG: TylF/MycF/NovP-related O-methyltransferase [bacterium]